MEARKAVQEELDIIYMMGFDVWADGTSKEDYLNDCRTSPKYKKGQWYVLVDESSLLSSLIVYDFKTNTFGIGSISTPLESRKHGHASKLISEVLKEIDNNHPASTVFLYSDIESKFYEQFGFVTLASHEQLYKTTTCMIRGTSKNIIPTYF